MPRRSEYNPYQLPFIFESSPEPVFYPSTDSTFKGADSREPGIGRFVREVTESITVRTPADAADYLMQRVLPSFILAHNHPSSGPEPSREDIRLTEQAVEASRLLDVELLDHIIVGAGCFVSLKERRLGFP